MNEINETRFGEYHEYMMVNIKGHEEGENYSLSLQSISLNIFMFAFFLLLSYLILHYQPSLPIHFSSNQLRLTHSLATERKIPEDV